MCLVCCHDAAAIIRSIADPRRWKGKRADRAAQGAWGLQAGQTSTDADQTTKDNIRDSRLIRWRRGSQCTTMTSVRSAPESFTSWVSPNIPENLCCGCATWSKWGLLEWGRWKNVCIRRSHGEVFTAPVSALSNWADHTACQIKTGSRGSVCLVAIVIQEQERAAFH